MITIRAQDADTVLEWFNTRGGIAIWGCLNLAYPGTTWTTPLDGTKPHWAATNVPIETITDPAEVQVIQYEEYKRFHVGIRLGSQGLSWKLTDGASRRLDRALDKGTKEAERRGFDVPAIYDFDYVYQEAVILVPVGTYPLTETKRSV